MPDDLDLYDCPAGCPLVIFAEDAGYHQEWHRQEESREALPGKGRGAGEHYDHELGRWTDA